MADTAPNEPVALQPGRRRRATSGYVSSLMREAARRRRLLRAAEVERRGAPRGYEVK